MKKLLSLTIISLLLILCSCSRSNRSELSEQANLIKKNLVTFRGVSLESGIVAPIYSPKERADLYKKGDTVWVNKSTNIISIRYWPTRENTFGNLYKFRIEEDNSTTLSRQDSVNLYKALMNLNKQLNIKEEQ